MTKYRIEYWSERHGIGAWLSDYNPGVYFETMTAAELAAMGPEYAGLKTRVVVVSDSAG